MYVSAERSKDSVYVWERHPEKGRILKQYPAPMFFYVEDEDGDTYSIFDNLCSRVDFDDYSEFVHASRTLKKHNYKVFESDVNPVHKILSQQYYNTDTPNLHLTFYDIEVDYSKDIGHASAMNPYAPVNAVSLYHKWLDQQVVIAVPPKNWGNDPNKWEEYLDHSLKEISQIILVQDETELLKTFLDQIQDTDALSGWNSSFFDDPYMCKRIENTLGQAFVKKLSFHKARPPQYSEVERWGNTMLTCQFGGRINVDYLELFQKFEMEEWRSYSLETVSNELLDLPKLDYEGTLADQYTDDFNFFIRYSIRDTECLTQLEDLLGYFQLANEMCHSSTALFKNVLGTIKPAELSVMNYCHYHLNKVVPDTPEPDFTAQSAEGAFVLTPKAGYHESISSVDVGSLYPSTIRALNISPEKVIGQFADEVRAYKAIHNNEDVELTMIYDKLVGGGFDQKPVSEWKQWLIDNNYAVSGYGTVFNQNSQGIFPSVLENWFAIRKDYKNKKAEYGAKVEQLKEQGVDSSNQEMVKAKEGQEYYDRLQYCFKIKLNSFYGAQLNKYYKYFDKRLGESTTGSGRAILTFMCSKINEIMTGEFDIDGNAVVYGDTDSCYFKTYTEDLEKAVEIGDNVAEQVNKTFPEFLRTSFLCQPGFDHHITAEREVVARSGIFVTPKRYALNVVDNEGEKVDKAKIMGLDIKKTIIPKMFQDALSEFIMRYLRGEKWNSIAQDIVDFKQDLVDTDVALLGLPKRIQNLEFYTRQFEQDSSAKIPGHVAAAIHYNRCLESFNDKESPRIHSGDKIQVYYLTEKTGPNNRFKSIALPTDIKDVPEWFYQSYSVDVNAQLIRLVDNPLKNILKAIGKEPPTKQLLFTEDALEFE